MSDTTVSYLQVATTQDYSQQAFEYVASKRQRIIDVANQLGISAAEQKGDRFI